MTPNFRTFSFLFMIITMVLAISCSKDDDNNEDVQQPDPPVLIAKAVNMPDAMIQSTDSGAMQAESYVNMANAYTGLTTVMLPPEKSSGFKSLLADPWKFNWIVNEGPNDYTAKLTITELTDVYAWEMTVTGTMTGETFDNWTYMTAQQAIDETWGTFTMYDPDDLVVGTYVTWTENSQGTYQLAFEVPELLRIKPNENPDGSGAVEMEFWNFPQYDLQFRAEWTASGSGQWWQYDDGNVIDQGSW